MVDRLAGWRRRVQDKEGKLDSRRLFLTMGVDKKSRSKDVISREYTINLHKALHGVTFKKRAPKAVRAVRAYEGGFSCGVERWRAGYESRVSG
jgi:hypothetical protein